MFSKSQNPLHRTLSILPRHVNRSSRINTHHQDLSYAYSEDLIITKKNKADGSQPGSNNLDIQWFEKYHLNV